MKSVGGNDSFHFDLKSINDLVVLFFETDILKLLVISTCKYFGNCSIADFFFRICNLQGAHIVEERLDDAINVLRNHAECQSVSPQFSSAVPVTSQFHQYHVRATFSPYIIDSVYIF